MSECDHWIKPPSHEEGECLLCKRQREATERASDFAPAIDSETRRLLIRIKLREALKLIKEAADLDK